MASMGYMLPASLLLEQNLLLKADRPLLTSCYFHLKYVTNNTLRNNCNTNHQLGEKSWGTVSRWCKKHFMCLKLNQGEDRRLQNVWMHSNTWRDIRYHMCTCPLVCLFLTCCCNWDPMCLYWIWAVIYINLFCPCRQLPNEPHAHHTSLSSPLSFSPSCGWFHSASPWCLSFRPYL